MSLSKIQTALFNYCVAASKANAASDDAANLDALDETHMEAHFELRAEIDVEGEQLEEIYAVDGKTIIGVQAAELRLTLSCAMQRKLARTLEVAGS